MEGRRYPTWSFTQSFLLGHLMIGFRSRLYQNLQSITMTIAAYCRGPPVRLWKPVCLSTPCQLCLSLFEKCPHVPTMSSPEQPCGLQATKAAFELVFGNCLWVCPNMMYTQTGNVHEEHVDKKQWILRGPMLRQTRMVANNSYLLWVHPKNLKWAITCHNMP